MFRKQENNQIELASVLGHIQEGRKFHWGKQENELGAIEHQISLIKNWASKKCIRGQSSWSISYY